MLRFQLLQRGCDDGGESIALPEAAVAPLAAGTTATPYQPLDQNRAASGGYSEEGIEPSDSG